MGIFLVLAGLVFGLGATLLRGLGLVLLWPAVAYLTVGVAYLADAPRLLGKRPDGGIAWWWRALLFPYFVLAWASWHFIRRAGEACHDEVAPGIWVGRRPVAGELPASVGLIVDMTAEFPRHRSLRGTSYRCLPTLDGTAPRADALRALVAEVAAAEHGVYIHCAAGHARSATAAAAVLLARRLVDSIDEAERVMRLRRPRVRINARQRRFLAAFLAGRRASETAA